MKTVAIESNGFMVPEKWEECSQGQLTKLLPLQLMWSDDLDPAKVGKLKAMALKILMPGLAKFAKDLEEDQWFRLGRLTNWVFDTKVTKKPFDYFSHEGVSYYLPDENFTNTTSIEVAMANIQYIQFTRPETPNPKAVLLLIATLCRPIRKDLKAFKQSNDWNGDKREEYNTILAEERAVQFSRLPFGVIMAISQYFEAMNGRFLETFKDVYEPDPTVDDEPPLYQNGEGLITTFMEIGKDGVFGDFDKVCHQNAHTIWIYLRDNNLKVKRANLRAEKARLQEG